MPITPDEAEAVDRTHYDHYTSVIDAGLRSGNRTFARALFPDALIGAIASEYRDKGWDVRLQDDWRDGDYLEFSRPRSR